MPNLRFVVANKGRGVFCVIQCFLRICMFVCDTYPSRHSIFKPCFIRNFCLTARSRSLNDFFDNPKNWGTSTVASGRPWRTDELRLKSSVDLHNLWYVLLKERNMLMTMEEEHWRCLERMPNPERFEKVRVVFKSAYWFFGLFLNGYHVRKQWR